MKTVPPLPLDFAIIIRYPSTYSQSVHGHGINICYIDGNNRPQHITTCGALTVYADANHFVWAEAELFATEDGKPIFTGEPVVRNNEIVTKVFTCHVREIQSVPSYSAGYKTAYEYITGKKPPQAPMKMFGRKAVKT